jgi:hypothetical protein
MTCAAIPNPHFPPGEAVAEADLVLGSLDELPGRLERSTLARDDE